MASDWAKEAWWEIHEIISRRFNNILSDGQAADIIRAHAPKIDVDKVAEKMWRTDAVPLECADNYEIVGVQFETQADLTNALRGALEADDAKS